MLDWFLNTFIRLGQVARIILGVVLTFVAIFSLMYAIRKKNDKSPIAWGWAVLFLVSGFFSILYFVA